MDHPATIRIDPGSPDRAALRDAARVVAAGGVVVLPTDTVYGIGADSGNPAALEKLGKIKARPGGKPFALLLSSADDVYRHASPIPTLAHRLMRKFWPGPLTIVLPSPSGGTVGLRVPALAATREIIRLSGRAMSVSSANVSGVREPLTAEEAVAALGSAPDLVVDAGPCRHGKASTVVRVDGRGYEVLREGVVPAAEIGELAYAQVLFVCTGNTCRSPMAEGLMKKALADRTGIPDEHLARNGFRVVSAGTSAAAGYGASYEAVEAMAEIGVDIGGHRSAPVSATLVDESDLVFVMTARHRDVLVEMSGAAPGKIALLDPDGSGVSDPIGGGIGTYRRARDLIAKAVSRRVDEVVAARPGKAG